MLEQPHRLLLHQLRDHIAQNGPNRIESLVGCANICKTNIIEQDFLDNEDGDGLAEFGAGLHDAETQGNNLGRKEEVNNIRRIIFNQRTNDTERREAEIFERARLGSCVQEGVEEERNVGCSKRGLASFRPDNMSQPSHTIQKQRASLVMGRDTLQQGQCIADPI